MDTDNETTTDQFSDSEYEKAAREAYQSITEDPEIDAAEPEVEEPEHEEPEADETEEVEQETKSEAVEEKRSRKKKKFDYPEELTPPVSWTAEGKEYFKKLPKEVQQEHYRVDKQFNQWREAELAKVNQLKQESEQLVRSLEGPLRVVRDFLPVWGAQGVTTEQAFTRICSFIETAKKNPEEATARFAKDLGLEIEIKNSRKGVANSQQISVNDIDAIVNQRLQTLQQNQYAEQQSNHVVSSVAQAKQDLMNEVNDQGNYIYPDMHNPDFVQQMSPLVSGIAQRNPNQPWRETLAQAYRALQGRIIPRRTNNITRTNGNVAAARRARTSLPGNASISAQPDLEYVPNESAEETARRAMQQVFGR